MKVYVSHDRLWRVEVRDDGRVDVWRGKALAGRYTSITEAAQYLADQGLTVEDLAED